MQIVGRGTGLFELEPPKVRVELRAKGKCVSQPVSASYGFEDATGEVKLKVAEDNPKVIEPNTVTLMIVEEITQKTVGVHLLDATSGSGTGGPGQGRSRHLDVKGDVHARTRSESHGGLRRARWSARIWSAR